MKNEYYFDVHNVQDIMDVSQSKAYQVIKELNQELKDLGFWTVAGKVPKKFFNEKFYLGGNIE